MQCIIYIHCVAGGLAVFLIFYAGYKLTGSNVGIGYYNDIFIWYVFNVL